MNNSLKNELNSPLYQTFSYSETVNYIENLVQIINYQKDQYEINAPKILDDSISKIFYDVGKIVDSCYLDLRVSKEFIPIDKIQDLFVIMVRRLIDYSKKNLGEGEFAGSDIIKNARKGINIIDKRIDYFIEEISDKKYHTLH